MVLKVIYSYPALVTCYPPTTSPAATPGCSSSAATARSAVRSNPSYSHHPFLDPRTQPLHRLLAECNNWSCHNVLIGLVIPPQYVWLYLVQSRLLHFLQQGGVLPYAVRKLL